MAKIILSHFSPIIDHYEYQSLIYYDALVKELVNCGSTVVQIISSDFLDKPWNGDNKLKANIDEEKLIQYVKDFDPDLLIVFNNSIPKCILENASCPITLWHGDSFKFFNDKQFIFSNLDRFHFICPFEDTASYLKSVGVADKNILKILPATGIKAETLNQDKNISFIGSPFISGYNFYNYLKETSNRSQIKKIANLLLDNKASGDYQTILESENCLELFDRIPFEEISSLYSSEKRILTLSLLSHMGLELYGSKEWLDTALYHPWLAMSYDAQKVYSLKHNQDIYNTSKISINISHTQATEGFPWRVMDIMASNSLLVSDKNKGIAEFTKGYVDIPMYESPIEAYELCKRLLNNENERKELILASQECIKNRGTWVSRFRELESALKINFVDPSGNNKGHHIRLRSKDYTVEVRETAVPQKSMAHILKDLTRNTIIYRTARKIYHLVR